MATAMLTTLSVASAFTATAARIIPTCVFTQLPWRFTETANEAPFQEIRFVFPCFLSDDEILQVWGCLGYALTEEVRGHELPLPHIERVDFHMLRVTILTFDWDSSQCIRTYPDFRVAFDLARRYIEEGTPIRKTDKAGEGTRGTRRVEGLGHQRSRAGIVIR